MKEKIGNIILDYEYYPGKDLYSDGQVEDELLAISKKYEETELNQVISEKKSWPVMYHFSHIRRNIVEWLPVSCQDTVLEIGAGCGAITGALAQKAKKVTCVELSRKRSYINAHRNKNYNNVEILVGNFQDIADNLQEKFDYITLIGVFEYSEGYIGGENPYVDMLKKVSGLLKPYGKLVIAIENRLGMKYWAGCTEDHVGRYYEGLEGYPETRGVRTFSLKELKSIFAEAGNLQYEMYYPYPDYKFPMQIYSDQWLPQTGELREINYNFDRSRIRLYDETSVADSLISNDLFPEFSNSFLVIASPDMCQENKERAIYTKFSNERRENFSLRTQIIRKSDGKLTVKKFSENFRGWDHLKQIHDYGQKLSELYRNTPIRLNQCLLKETHIELEYLKGITLEQVLDHLVEEKKYEQVWDTLHRYLEELEKVANSTFEVTAAFEKIFGPSELTGRYACAPITNIDVVCSNIIWTDQIWHMLDYEWTYEFPIPVKYQIYRVIKYYLYTSTIRKPLLQMGFFERAGISEDEILIFDRMEEKFQKYILGQLVPIRHMYEAISPGTVFDLKKYSWKDHNIHVYVDYGDDFSENNSWFLQHQGNGYRGTINVPNETVRLRIDPCEESCMVYLKGFFIKDQEEWKNVHFICNGECIGEHLYYFDTEDPYFIMDEIPDGVSEILAEMEFLSLNQNKEHILTSLLEKSSKLEECQKKTDKKYQELLQRMQKLELELNEKTEQLQMVENSLNEKTLQLQTSERTIQEMKNTKVWKLYSACKRGIGKHESDLQ